MECQNLKYLTKKDKNGCTYPVSVPCGRCVFCMATARSDWATRLHWEARLHLDSYFITLTYADCHLRWKKGVPQLVKKDLQDWFKRVRKTGAKIRYYAVGEYGAKTFRPHYHVILFGYVPDKVLRKTWPFGLMHIGKVTQASIHYCLGYVLNGKGWKMKTTRQPPFTIMSRGSGIPGDKFQYGIGHNYLSPAMVAWHKSGLKNYTVIYGIKRHLPRYYKCKIFKKLDLVRISVRENKQAFQRMVDWVRSPAMRRQADPLAYRAEQLKRLAQTIRLKTKENLTL